MCHPSTFFITRWRNCTKRVFSSSLKPALVDAPTVTNVLEQNALLDAANSTTPGTRGRDALGPLSLAGRLEGVPGRDGDAVRAEVVGEDRIFGLEALPKAPGFGTRAPRRAGRPPPMNGGEAAGKRFPPSLCPEQMLIKIHQ
jgi:hypothetical protein